MGTATGYITDIGRCKRYRLLTPVGSSINESHAALDSIKKRCIEKTQTVQKDALMHIQQGYVQTCLRSTSCPAKG